MTGERTALTRGNGTSTAYGYDPILRLTVLNDNLAGTVQDRRAEFTYDNLSRILSRAVPNDAYAWSGYVNLTRTYTANGLNQYLTSGGLSLGYDGNGNLTNGGEGILYGYNAYDQLVSATGGVALAYDAVGRLTYTNGAEGATRFDYDGTDLVTELSSTGAVLRRYVHGPGVDEPLVWYEGAGLTDRRWLHADERGSIVAVTGANAAAIPDGIYAYDAYGIPEATYAGRFQYTGQTFLPELGMYYYKARIYSPTLGRFVQTDPIGYAAGMNVYAYVGGDPVNYTDPSGLVEIRSFCRVTHGVQLEDYAPSIAYSCEYSSGGDSYGGGGGYVGEPRCHPTGRGGVPVCDQNVGTLPPPVQNTSIEREDVERAKKDFAKACGQDQASRACQDLKAKYFSLFKTWNDQNPLPKATGPKSPSILEVIKRYLVDSVGCALGVAGVGATGGLISFLGGALTVDSCINTINNGMGR